MERKGAPDPGDSMDGRALWCELWIDAEGDITLTRGRGCTPADAVELCRLTATGDPAVNDLFHRAVRSSLWRSQPDRIVVVIRSIGYCSRISIVFRRPW